MAASTYGLGLLEDSKLRESFTMRPPKNMQQLMRRIEEYKRMKDVPQQRKGKAPTTSQYKKDS